MITENIFFLIDHKHRDLPTSVLIGNHLEDFGYNVFYFPVNYGSLNKEISEKNPKAIIIPKPNFNQSETIFWSLKGIYLIVVETEGNHQDKEIVYRVLNKPNLYITWNHNIANLYKRVLGKETEIKVGGFHRGDLLHQNYRHLYGKREENLNSLGLNPKNFTVTIATSTQVAHLSKSRLQEQYKRRNAKFKTATDIYLIHKNQIQLRETSVNLIKKLSKYSNINIIIKPHPNENATFWHDLIQSLDSPRIRLIIAKSINELLSCSDLHLSHNVCTTTIESLMLDIPTIEIHARFSYEMYKKEHLELANFYSDDQDLIFEKIMQIMDGLKFKDKTKLNDYVNEYFYAFDGIRSNVYADEINKFLENAKPLSLLKTIISNPLVIIAMSLISIKTKILDWVSGRKKRIDIVNNPTKESSFVTNISNTLVDKEYGLADNRIKIGDENYWKERFVNK